MENQHFLDEENLNPQSERPTFLTVLCIITFIVSGIMLIYTTFGALSYDVEEQREAMEIMVDEMSKQDNLEGFTEMMTLVGEEEIENHTLLTLISLGAILLSLLGAFLMFRLKKTGFHLYIGSKILSFVPLLIFTLSWPILATYTLMGVFALAFVIMYGVNLKHMN
ncbi:MAG: hypothetical protein ACPGVD_05045 [Flavobacteriales bacterium]